MQRCSLPKTQASGQVLPLLSLKVTSPSTKATLVFFRQKRAFYRRLPILSKKCTLVTDLTRVGMTLPFEITVASHWHCLILSLPVLISYVEPTSWQSQSMSPWASFETTLKDKMIACLPGKSPMSPMSCAWLVNSPTLMQPTICE
jgi:hypothetical protein